MDAVENRESSTSNNHHVFSFVFVCAGRCGTPATGTAHKQSRFYESSFISSAGLQSCLHLHLYLHSQYCISSSIKRHCSTSSTITSTSSYPWHNLSYCTFPTSRTNQRHHGEPNDYYQYTQMSLVSFFKIYFFPFNPILMFLMCILLLE